MAKQARDFRQAGFRAPELMWELGEEIQDIIETQTAVRPPLADVFREAILQGLRAKLNAIKPSKDAPTSSAY